MKPLAAIMASPALQVSASGPDGFGGIFRRGKVDLQLIVSNGGGWDHVSVVAYQQAAMRTPRWDEMCAVKDLCFYEHEPVMQIHPAKAKHINVHRHCLHLWRPQGRPIPLPPGWMVG